MTTQVLGPAASSENFLYGGFIVSEGIRDALRWIGRPLESFGDVLDFGCGSARILRWFSLYTGSCRFVGCDISRQAIEWNNRYLGFGEFVAHEVEPPLSFPRESFDLIYGISVVTHLSESLQLAWLSELERVLRPGGIAMLTVSGEEVARWKLSPEDFEQYQRRGHFYKKVQEGGLHGLPDFYQDAYHLPSYVAREWARYFHPAAYIRNGPMFFQDLVILQKPQPANAPQAEVRPLSLPFGGIYQPKIADTVMTRELVVSGWAFQLDGESVALNLSIDGMQAASCIAAEPSPRLASVYPPAAGQKRGFSAVLPLEGLHPGPHVLKCSVAGGMFPYLSTYFFVG